VLGKKATPIGKEFRAGHTAQTWRGERASFWWREFIGINVTGGCDSLGGHYARDGEYPGSASDQGAGPWWRRAVAGESGSCHRCREPDLVSWKNHLVPRLNEAGWQTVCLRSDKAWDLRWVWRLRKLVKADGIDVVHGHSPLVSAFARVMVKTLPRERRPRMIYTEHNEWGRHRPWTRRLNRWTIGMEDHVIAVSRAVKDSMPQGLDVEVLIHGIDVQAVAAQKVHRAAVRQELGIEDDETVIGIVANFRKEKAYDVLLDAAAIVIAQNPKTRFVSVGQGPLEAEVRAQHKRLGLGDRFLILGYREDATRIMSAFDIFTLSSRHEGLPVSLMEAMALDLPVLATAVGGIPEAVEGTSAMLVEPGEAEALADACLSFAEPTRVATVSLFDGQTAASRLVQRYCAPRGGAPE